MAGEQKSGGAPIWGRARDASRGVGGTRSTHPAARGNRVRLQAARCFSDKETAGIAYNSLRKERVIYN